MLMTLKVWRVTQGLTRRTSKMLMMLKLRKGRQSSTPLPHLSSSRKPSTLMSCPWKRCSRNRWSPSIEVVGNAAVAEVAVGMDGVVDEVVGEVVGEVVDEIVDGEADGEAAATSRTTATTTYAAARTSGPT